MIKRLLVLTVVLIAFSFGSVYAAQLDGMATLDGPALPNSLRTFINPSGVGDVLVYPYYNVRDNKVTYFNIVNSNTVDGEGVIVKLRFREAATIAGDNATATGCEVIAGGFYTAGDYIDCGSNEVLDFNVCLSHGDVYTGMIVSDASGAGKFVSLDTDTLTNPIVPAAGVVFRSGAANPTKGITADNTREGYFEVLAFGEWDDTSDTCDDTTGNDAPNRLSGTAIIVDQDTNATYAYVPTAIADCRFDVFAVSLANDNFTLENCQRADGNDDADLASDHVDQVDYPLTKVNVGNMYYVDPALKGRTDFVITFPTRRLNDVYHDGFLFSNPVVIFEVWDDKENTITPTGDFSPSTTVTNTLPHEVNVLNIKDAHNGMFTSDVDGVIPSDWNYGWIAIDLMEGATAPGISNTFYSDGLVVQDALTFGLPAIALVFQDAVDQAWAWALPMKYATFIISDIGAISP